MPKKRKAREKKGKRIRKKSPKSKKSKHYVLEGGGIIKKGKECPKCGSGVFLAEHRNRLTCGKCGYSEIKLKKENVEK